MNKDFSNWYKIPIRLHSGCPTCWTNFIQYYEKQNLDNNEHHRLLSKEIIENYNGRFILTNGELEPIDQYLNIVDYVVFENYEDATAFMLKWS